MLKSSCIFSVELVGSFCFFLLSNVRKNKIPSQFLDVICIPGQIKSIYIFFSCLTVTWCYIYLITLLMIYNLHTTSITDNGYQYKTSLIKKQTTNHVIILASAKPVMMLIHEAWTRFPHLSVLASLKYFRYLNSLGQISI